MGWLLLALTLVQAAIDTSPWLVVALPVIAFAATRSVFRHAYLTGRNTIHALYVDREKLLAATTSGHRPEVHVSDNSRLFSHLALLKLTSANSTEETYTVILIDTPLVRNVDSDDFRRLRVWLRFALARRQDSTTSPL